MVSFTILHRKNLDFKFNSIGDPHFSIVGGEIPWLGKGKLKDGRCISAKSAASVTLIGKRPKNVKTGAPPIKAAPLR